MKGGPEVYSPKVLLTRLALYQESFSLLFFSSNSRYFFFKETRQKKEKKYSYSRLFQLKYIFISLLKQLYANKNYQQYSSQNKTASTKSSRKVVKQCSIAEC